MSKWISGYKAAFLTFGGKWILAGNKLLASSENGNVEVVKTGKVPYVRITNNYIMQKNGDFRTIPDFKELNGDGLRIGLCLPVLPLQGDRSRAPAYRVCQIQQERIREFQHVRLRR